MNFLSKSVFVAKDCEHSSPLQGCEQGELLSWLQEEGSGEGQGEGFCHQFLSYSWSSFVIVCLTKYLLSSFVIFCHLLFSPHWRIVLSNRDERSGEEKLLPVLSSALSTIVNCNIAASSHSNNLTLSHRNRRLLSNSSSIIS